MLDTPLNKHLEIGEIIKQLAELSNSFDKAQHDFLRDHPGIDASNDARATVFTHCYLVLDSIYVCLVVRSYEASDLDWWEKMIQDKKMTRQFKAEDLSVFLSGFNSFIISAYLCLLSGAVESAFRIFHEAVFLHSDVPIDISSVCDNLLSSRGLGLEDYLKLIKLLRLLRNSLAHNNGRHIKNDDNAGWNNVSIDFRKGYMVHLGESSWEVMFVIANGIREMLQKVINSDPIIKKPIIKDPSYASSHAS